MSTPDVLQNEAAVGMPSESRGVFVRRAYMHTVGGIMAFAAIEWGLFSTGLAWPLAQAMLSVNWLLILGAYMLVSWGASHMAHRIESRPMQYLAFAALIVAEAAIFVPLLAIAMNVAPGVVESAAWVTLMGSAGLIVVATISGKDFSFLRGFLLWGFVLAMVAIVSAVLFGFELGTWFSVAMIGFAGAAILYDTSNILRTYPEDRYVAAGMQLFASIALMFWYVLRFFMSRD